MSRLDEMIQKLCPDGVGYKKLGKIAEVGTGSSNGNEAADDGMYPFFIRSQTIKFKNDFEYDDEAIIIPGEGGIGEIFHYVDGKYALHQRVYRIHFTTDEVKTKFAYYYMQAYFKPFIMKRAVSATVTSIRKPMIEEFAVPIPPLPVQVEIVRILDYFTQLAAELAAELAARKSQYQYYRDNLMQNVRGEKIRIIDMLAQPVTDGPHTTPAFVEAGVPFISVDAVWDGKIHFENMRGYITEEFDLECCKKYKPQKHDVYMVKSGSTTGKVAYVDTDMRFNIWSPLAAMRVNDKNSSRYLYHLLQTKSIQEQVKAKSSRGSQPNLSMRVLEQFQVKVPPLPEQKRIADILDRFDTLCHDQTGGLPAEIEARRRQYEYYRDKLLTFKEKEAI